MRIAVDAMGGDFAPAAVVAGALDAASRLPGIQTLYLVGLEDAVKAELGKARSVPDTVRVHPCTEVVAMDEPPAQAVRRKKDSSISRGIDLIKQGEADAFVSAGNTGAVVAASTLKLRTLEGVERPAIAAVMPSQGAPFVLIDAGANIDAGPVMLAQFAVMGSVYAREILKKSEPVVGVLSVGAEDIKGNDTTREAFRLLHASHLNFRGNVEGHDLFTGEVDVAVCDGFVGNAVLKSTESASRAIHHWLKVELTRTLWRRMLSMALMPAFRAMKWKLDPELYGGAPLLGVNGVCIITHGASSATGIFHAIRVASESVHHRINHMIVEEVHRVAEAGRRDG